MEAIKRKYNDRNTIAKTMHKVQKVRKIDIKIDSAQVQKTEWKTPEGSFLVRSEHVGLVQFKKTPDYIQCLQKQIEWCKENDCPEQESILRLRMLKLIVNV